MDGDRGWGRLFAREGRLRRRRPSSRQGSGTPGADPLKWLCQKWFGFFSLTKNAKSLESLEERVSLSSSFPLGLKAHKKLPRDYRDGASGREWQLKIGCLVEIS